MKRVLITGKGSYIGSHFRDYLKEFPNDYYVEELDVRDDSWKQFDFSKFDVVYHVAGIAHIKETKENAILYYKVNRDLAVEIAKLSKSYGVKHFIFMSSMSVYGLIYSNDLITVNTKTNPNTNYGKSKLQAENEILKLADDTFKVSVLRPPMVYGKNSPGNMTKLINAVKKVHIFPTLKNERSSITIDKLCESILDTINEEKEGILLPQNDQYMCTYDTVRSQVREDNIKVVYISLFNPILRLLIGKVGVITKMFGDLKYER